MGFNRGAFQSALGGGSGLRARGGGAAAVPWYLSGGVLAAECVGAYQAAGVADLAASYANLANAALPLTEIAAPPWDIFNGWKFSGTQILDTGLLPVNGYSAIIRYSAVTAAGYAFGCFNADATYGIGFEPINKVLAQGAYTTYPTGFPTYGVVGLSNQSGYLNGSVVKTGIAAGSGTVPPSIYIGKTNWTTSSPAHLYVQALAIYKSNITEAQVLAITNAIYKPTGLIFDGDSLTAGVGGATPYPTQMAALCLFPFYVTTVGNYGVPGQTIVQMASDAAAQIDPLLTATTKTLFAWGGINDMATGTSDEPTTYTNYADYCTARRAAGWKVVASTLTPSKSGATIGGYEALRQTFNSEVRANWSTFADALCDVGNDATIGQAASPDNATYYQADKIHLTTAGNAIVAALAKTAFDTLA